MYTFLDYLNNHSILSKNTLKAVFYNNRKIQVGRLLMSLVDSMFSIEMLNINEYSLNTQNVISIILILEGRVRYNLNHEPGDLNFKDILLINRRDECYFESDDPNIIFILKISCRFIARFLDTKWDPRFKLLSLIDESNQKEIYDTLIRLVVAYYYLEKDTNPFSINQHVVRILYLLSKYHQEEVQDDPKYSIQTMIPLAARDNRYIRNVLDYIDTNYQHTITLGEMAKREFISNSYLSRLFKQVTGMNFTEYLNLYRLKQVAYMLRTTNDSISKIAMGCGFLGISNFNRQFKKEFGITPQEYVSQNKRVYPDTSKNHLISIYKLSRREEKQSIAKFLVNNKLMPMESNIQNKDIHISPDPRGNEYVEQLQLDIMVNIGLAKNLLILENQAQIDELISILNIRYIRMDGFPEGFPNDNFLPSIHYSSGDGVMQYLIDNDLLPIFTISALELVESDNKSLILNTLRHYNIQFDSPPIIIELDVDIEQFNLEMYINAIQLLREWDNIKIGLGISISHASDKKSVSNWIKSLTIHGILPEFLNVSIRTERNFSKIYDILENIRDTLNMMKMPTKLLIGNWNIQKNPLNPVNYYDFRAADLLETLLGLRRYTNILGFWLNNQHSCTVDNYEYLSLYYIGNIRRPIHFLLTFLERLDPQNQSLQHGGNYIANMGKSRIAILIYVPYVKDILDNKEIVRISDCVSINLSVDGFDPGNYYYKELTLDEKHGGIFPEWVENIGFSMETDREMTDYLSNINRPQMKVDNLKLKGSFEVNLRLNINDCKLLILQKK